MTDDDALDRAQHLETEHADLLALCHAAPQAVGMDTTHLRSAIQRLLNFAWEAVQGPDPHAKMAADQSLQEFAAIRLGVPRTGTPWIDAMIIESRRLHLAGQAMQGMITRDDSRGIDAVVFVTEAFMYADAMLAEWSKRDE